jgi:hypothetical protein
MSTARRQPADSTVRAGFRVATLLCWLQIRSDRMLEKAPLHHGDPAGTKAGGQRKACPAAGEPVGPHPLSNPPAIPGGQR